MSGMRIVRCSNCDRERAVSREMQTCPDCGTPFDGDGSGDGIRNDDDEEEKIRELAEECGFIRYVAILEAFDEPRTNAEAMEVSRIPQGTFYRYLNDLRDLGLIEPVGWELVGGPDVPENRKREVRTYRRTIDEIRIDLRGRVSHPILNGDGEVQK